MPIHHLDDPVYMEVIPDQTAATITVVLTHKDEVLTGLPFTLNQLRGRRWFNTTSGQRMRVPAGEYIVTIDNALRPVQDWFEQRKLVLDPSGNHSFRFDIPFAMVPIRVSPRLPHPEFDAALNIRLFHGGGSSTSLFGWTPDRGPVRFLVPEEPIRLYIEAEGFENATWRGIPGKSFPVAQPIDFSKPHEIVMKLEHVK